MDLGRTAFRLVVGPLLRGKGLALAQFAGAAAGAALLTAERAPAVEAAPAEDEVTAQRQERFTRTPSEVHAES